MSLITFHRLLIAAGILFCAGYAAWELRVFLERGGWLPLLLALSFLAGAAGLGYYLWNLPRFLRLDRDRGPPR